MFTKIGIISILLLISFYPDIVICQKLPLITFKEKKIKWNDSEVEKNIIIKSGVINSFYNDSVAPGEKMWYASIESIIWSPNSQYISFRVSQMFTGDTDAIWNLNIKKKTYYPVTKDFYKDSVWSPHFFSPYNAWTLDNKLYIRVQHYKHTHSSDSYWARFYFNPVDSSFEEMTRSVMNKTLPDILPLEKRISPVDHIIVKDLTISSQLLYILERYTFEGIDISPNGKFIIAEQPTYHNEPGPLYFIDVKNNSAYESKLIVSQFDNGSAEIQRWHSSGNIYCKEIFGELHFINLETKTDYILQSANYYFLGGIFSPDKTSFAIVGRYIKDSQYFVTVLPIELFSFVKKNK